MNRKVFVTGGAHGIGKAIVEAFCKSGDVVAFCDINDILGEQVAAQTGAKFYEVDVRSKTQLEMCLDDLEKEWGDIDVIVNNVGVSSFGPLTEVSVEDFDDVIAANLRSAFITSRFLAILREKTRNTSYGRIINMCSSRYLMSEAGTEAYSASKGGIYSLTHALSVSLAPYKITVNAIAPGWIHVKEDEQLREEDHNFHPSGRVGTPEDVASMCLYLCENSSDFINGQTITLDGGVTKKMIYPE